MESIKCENGKDAIQIKLPWQKD